MKTLTPTFFFILISSMLYGQDLTGQWAGILNVQGNQLKIVLHINKINNQYEATLDSPGQSASGIKVTAASFSYPTVKLEISSIGAVYEGTMTDKSITGKWVQSGTALFLALIKNEDSPSKDK